MLKPSDIKPGSKSSIPSAALKQLKKVISEEDLSLEAAEVKLEFAVEQAKDINSRVEKIEQHEKESREDKEEEDEKKRLEKEAEEETEEEISPG